MNVYAIDTHSLQDDNKSKRESAKACVVPQKSTQNILRTDDFARDVI